MLRATKAVVYPLVGAFQFSLGTREKFPFAMIYYAAGVVLIVLGIWSLYDLTKKEQ